jgi:microcystin-dependent protein
MEPYVGEVRMFGGTFAPLGWEFCNGQLLSIANNEVLYGGDGVNTFGVPDLRGRVPLHQGSGYVMGQMGGAETVTLAQQQMAVHTHAASAKTANGTLAAPVAHFWAGNAEVACFSSSAPDANFNAGAITAVGGGKPHENMMPFLALSFIIATAGLYPTQN